MFVRLVFVVCFCRYALIGNDVCNGHIDDYVNHMTTVDDMRANVQVRSGFFVVAG